MSLVLTFLSYTSTPLFVLTSAPGVTGFNVSDLDSADLTGALMAVAEEADDSLEVGE